MEFFACSNSCKKSVTANCTNNSFTLTGHYLGICHQKWIRVIMMIVSVFWIFWVKLWLLFFDIYISSLEIHLLINSHIHLFHQHTVSWNSVSWQKFNYVSNNQFLNWDAFNGSILSSMNSNQLFVHLFLQKQKLFLFQIVTQTSNEACHKKSSKDGKWLDKTILVRAKSCKQKINTCCPD